MKKLVNHYVGIVLLLLLVSSCKKEIDNTVKDADGNSYHTITIGTQVWMTENLKTTHYNDGTVIPLVTDSIIWMNSIVPSYCWYKNNILNKNTYGALYNWNTVNSGKLFPIGWRIPTDSDFITLVNTVNNNIGLLKEIGNIHWVSPNNGATNASGFTALPGGTRGQYGIFSELGQYGWWWTSVTANNLKAKYFLLDNGNNNYGIRSDGTFMCGMSVRCIKN